MPITTNARDLLVAVVRESSNGTDNFTVTDSAGQTWTQTASGYKNESGSGPRIGMFYVANSAALNGAITAHFTTSGGVIKPGIMVMEISGAAISGVLDGSVTNASGASVTTSSSASLSTTNANDILIFATDAAGNQTGWTAGPGYAIPNNKLAIGSSGSNVRMAMQYAVVSSAQTNTKTSMTYPNAAWNGNIFAAFRLAGSPILTFSPTSLTFGSQNLGTTSPAQTVTVTNTGSGPATIVNIYIGDAGQDDEFADTTNCPISPSTLAAGASCSINVTFTPDAGGTRGGILNVAYYNASNNQQTTEIHLTGTGVATASLTPSSLTFGNQQVGTTSAAQTLTVTNIGPTAFGCCGFAFGGNDPGDFFLSSNNCPDYGGFGTLAPGASCAIGVKFTPALGGTRAATLQVLDNASGSPQSVSLTGTGVSGAMATLSPTSLTFGNQTVATTSASQ